MKMKIASVDKDAGCRLVRTLMALAEAQIGAIT